MAPGPAGLRAEHGPGPRPPGRAGRLVPGPGRGPGPRPGPETPASESLQSRAAAQWQRDRDGHEAARPTCGRPALWYWQSASCQWPLSGRALGSAQDLTAAAVTSGWPTSSYYTEHQWGRC